MKTLISPEKNAPSSTGHVIKKDGINWYEIQSVESMPPFLMTLISDHNHWMYIASNGALTAGRRNPDTSLFPYYTQDKLLAMAGSTGTVTKVRIRSSYEQSAEWTVFSPEEGEKVNISRTLRKSEYGHRIEFEERHLPSGLKITMSWFTSRNFGFIRKLEITNNSTETLELDLLDGLQNIICPGIGERFQNQYSILGDAYKTASLHGSTNLAAYSLSAIPSDGTQPMEGLAANIVWHIGGRGATTYLTPSVVQTFPNHSETPANKQRRGQQMAYILTNTLKLSPGESYSYYMGADVNLDLDQAMEVANKLSNNQINAQSITEEEAKTISTLKHMLSSSDGIQHCRSNNMALRHMSNTMFNLMRGGEFAKGYNFPEGDLAKHVSIFQKEGQKYIEAFETQNGPINLLNVEELANSIPKDIFRTAREYLPLSFSRRHGDPSRPWNKFSIEIEKNNGEKRYHYEGNWRDIFQNWEALMQSYPAYLMPAIRRFLNASTADGYNPYRIMKNGTDWETPDPEDPWANIGYWGDHQIVYLLRLLESQEAYFPGDLVKELDSELYVFLQIPYNLVGFEEMKNDPRDTITYNESLASEIEQRVQSTGEDGKLYPDENGEVYYVSLLEKLLIPLLAKAGNFVPGAGIWMNTQRPEWNDANNALVGFGVSSVTASYCYRFTEFLLKLLDSADNIQSVQFSEAVVRLISDQLDIFSTAPSPDDKVTRLALMNNLGLSSSRFRDSIYNNNLSHNKSSLSLTEIRKYLQCLSDHLKATLEYTKRDDGLYESYVLLSFEKDTVSLHSLYPMLEGQVSILSSGLLNDVESIELLRALKSSSLYRADQNSYLLYPNRELPYFWDKNLIPNESICSHAWLSHSIDGGKLSFIRQLPDDKGYCFASNINNTEQLRSVMSALAQPLTSDQQQVVENIYEETFNHHAFTGRSGTFFAYEGLGSIYWHMVSKLVLAVQECAQECANRGSNELLPELRSFFNELKDGLGAEKPANVHGAIPTDAYSHTPEHSGAQQPGMTGQVKEDILWRKVELGTLINGGSISFSTELMNTNECLQENLEFNMITIDGTERKISAPEGSVVSSICQVPVVTQVSNNAPTEIRINYKDNTTKTIQGSILPQSISRGIFIRDHQIDFIQVVLN